MTSETTPERPTHAGEVVQDSRGRLGLVTEPVKKAGIYKGRLTVMWAYGRYEVTEWPEELTVVAPATFRSFAAALAAGTQS